MLCDRREWESPEIFLVHPGDKITKNIGRDIRTKGSEVVKKVFAVGGGHGGCQYSSGAFIVPNVP
jgi:hypothetical protein